MSLTSVDFPEPLTPVTAMKTPSGMVTSRFLRLFCRAPRMTSLFSPIGRRIAGTSIAASPRRYFAVSDDGNVLICSSVPSATTSPP
jgi:hypothetical protein